MRNPKDLEKNAVKIILLKIACRKAGYKNHRIVVNRQPKVNY